MEQSLQVMSKQERLENWAARIMACRSSGMTARTWCQENGLSEKTYYYWQRRLFQTLSEQQTMLKSIGQLTIERDFLQDCFRRSGRPVPELDPEKR